MSRAGWAHRQPPIIGSAEKQLEIALRALVAIKRAPDFVGATLAGVAKIAEEALRECGFGREEGP